MRVLINIYCGHESFDPDPAPELARILRRLADAYDRGERPRMLLDSDGNNVGQVMVEDFDTGGHK
jgi:hypothetical protein